MINQRPDKVTMVLSLGLAGLIPVLKAFIYSKSEITEVPERWV
jgi:hypothetical protein